MSHLVAPVKEEFERLFHATFSLKQNALFLSSVQVTSRISVCINCMYRLLKFSLVFEGVFHTEKMEEVIENDVAFC